MACDTGRRSVLPRQLGRAPLACSLRSACTLDRQGGANAKRVGSRGDCAHYAAVVGLIGTTLPRFHGSPDSQARRKSAHSARAARRSVK